jgi:3-oxoacyl-[acyl-carrier protein] reductase
MSKVILVTGASRGIGKAIAQQLGKNGDYIIGTATSSKGQEQITADFAQANITGSALICDVASDESVEQLFKQIASVAPSSVDILVNNAGITKDNLFMRMSAEQWSSVIDTNLNSMYRMCRGAIKGMVKKRWGRIINISSVVGATGNPGQANYCATKAGVIGFSKSLALEVGKRNITVNNIAPGFIATDMTDALETAQKDKILANIPMNRLGSAQEIAQVADFLASDAASYISGQTIHVNGGMYMA